MCGRYTLAKDFEVLAKRFNFKLPLLDYTPRYNIAPTQDVIAIINKSGKNEPVFFKWGLIPFRSKDKSIGSRMINARAETVDLKPSFASLLKSKRCLIPADGFYEWRKQNTKKIPFRILLKSQEIFSFAGLWDTWTSLDGETIESCTIITTTPNKLIEKIHNRMPVILTHKAEQIWLDNSLSDIHLLKSLLVPYSAEEMYCYGVSSIVNSPKNDSPVMIEI